MIQKHDHFDAISLNYNIPFDENKLFSRLHTFLVAQSVSVYRFKGIFYDPRKEKKLIIKSVMQSLHIEEGKYALIAACAAGAHGHAMIIKKYKA